MAIKPKISDQDFIKKFYKAQRAGHSLSQLAASMDATMGSVWSRINYFRKKKGVPLPPLKRQSKSAEKSPAPKAKLKKAMRSVPPKPAISAEDFVRIWQTSATMEEVCEKTGLDHEIARGKAAKLRAKGVPLKKFDPRGQGKLDLQKLIALAESLAAPVPQ